VFRIWDGGLGMAGLAGAAAAGAWLYCRRHGYAVAPMALAAVPALAVAQAVGTMGNWFNQRMYGSPSGLPWAVAIAPARRASQYESFSTFQPVFLYESLWDLVVAVALIIAIRRWTLTGGRAFALYAALYAAGRFVAEVMRIDSAPRLLGVRVTELAMLVIALSAAGYLYLTRSRHEQRRRQIAGDPVAGSSASSVPGAGFEPARPFGQMLLRHRRLPFRHPGINRDNNDLNAVRSRPSINLPVPGRFRRP
jgi:prolipoprotein diacylglyceryltransferase